MYGKSNMKESLELTWWKTPCEYYNRLTIN